MDGRSLRQVEKTINQPKTPKDVSITSYLIFKILLDSRFNVNEIILTVVRVCVCFLSFFLLLPTREREKKGNQVEL